MGFLEEGIRFWCQGACAATGLAKLAPLKGGTRAAACGTPSMQALSHSLSHCSALTKFESAARVLLRSCRPGTSGLGGRELARLEGPDPAAGTQRGATHAGFKPKGSVLADSAGGRCRWWAGCGSVLNSGLQPQGARCAVRAPHPPRPGCSGGAPSCGSPPRSAPAPALSP